MRLRNWVRFPSLWIEDGGLKKLRWGGENGDGSANTAALMALMPLAHHADDQTGVIKLTYDELCAFTGLSRAKLSHGIKVLENLSIIESSEKRSTYRLCDYNPAGGWAKLPAKTLYASGRIGAFDEFKLRSAAELNALKLYFLFAARRNRETNMAHISLDKIEAYAGLERHRIKAALNILAINNLAHVERVPSTSNPMGVANAYRLVGLDSYNHMGTKGRGMDAAITAFNDADFDEVVSSF